MSQDGNAYQGLRPERKLQLFLFEAERFITSIVGYSKLVSADAQRPLLRKLLSADFVQSLEAIEQTGGKFARSLRDITMPEETNSYRDALIKQTLLMVLNLSYSPISVITGYSALLDTEAQKLDLALELPPQFVDNLQMMHTAAERLSNTREELSESMK